MTATSELTYYIGAFVDELVKSGVNEVVISPGSRSTPIAIMMAEHPNLNIKVLIDERSAAFYALGLAKVTGKPVALLCTSGTAATNYYPAIVEAYYSRIPLVVITADRPHELRDVGAPQAIDQIKLYSDYAKWFVEMSLPSEDKGKLQYVRTVAARATGTALASPSGPVHLNFPLAEPLVPDLSLENIWTRHHEKKLSIMENNLGKLTITESEAIKISTLLSENKKGVIVCGELKDDEYLRAQIVTLAEKLQYPILADPLSQLRSGVHRKHVIVEGYDAFLRGEHALQELKPEVIIRFGSMPVSKFLSLYIKKTDCLQLIVDGDGTWRDPTLQATHIIHSDEALFCEAILPKLPVVSEQADWLNEFLFINETTKKVLTNHLDDVPLFEGKVISQLQQILPASSCLFVGNSMPIRDLDTFFFTSDKRIKLLANRGANGIDGVVSSALAASSVHEHTVLVIGDLSFYHDMNGLLAAKLLNLNITIVLINNNGGGIFSFLPQSKVEKHFEALFGTPTDLPFGHAVALYNGQYDKVENWQDFHEKIERAFSTKGLNVIEVSTNRLENEQLHRKMWENVSREIQLSRKKEF
ncbi:2-succinyl-5-enolpyruvyl-6-hydroxy-3-cyclohexene-1-carboxylic-acid synthase [Sutcliffiella cohnii]